MYRSSGFAVSDTAAVTVGVAEGHLRPPGDGGEGAEEARGEPGGEQLLRVGARALGAALGGAGQVDPSEPVCDGAVPPRPPVTATRAV